MRYTVGTKIWAIGLKLRSIERNVIVYPVCFMRPYPDQFSIEDIYFQELTVAEHHKVAGEWSNEKEYDGFILKDNQDRVWHNQYPKASYGQTSGEADGNFDSTLFEQLFEDNKDDKSFDWDKGSEKFIEIYGCPSNLFLFTRFLNDLNGGRVDDEGKTRNQHAEVWPKLEEIISRVTQKFTEVTGLKAVYMDKELTMGKPIRFRRWEIVKE